jgi:hypothetical protein
MGGPHLKIVRGDATAEEIAALVTALATLTPRPQAEQKVESWRNPIRRIRQPLRPGPGAWRASNLPF